MLKGCKYWSVNKILVYCDTPYLNVFINWSNDLVKSGNIYNQVLNQKCTIKPNHPDGVYYVVAYTHYPFNNKVRYKNILIFKKATSNRQGNELYFMVSARTSGQTPMHV